MDTEILAYRDISTRYEIAIIEKQDISPVCITTPNSVAFGQIIAAKIGYSDQLILKTVAMHYPGFTEMKILIVDRVGSRRYSILTNFVEILQTVEEIS